MTKPDEPKIPNRPRLCVVTNLSGKDLAIPYNGKIIVKFPDRVQGIPIATFKRYLKQVANDICEHSPIAIRASNIGNRANLVIEDFTTVDPLQPIIDYVIPKEQSKPQIARINFAHWSLSTYAGEASYKGLYHVLSHVICHACGCYHHGSSGVLNPNITLIHRSITDYDVDMLTDVPLFRELPSNKLRKGYL